MPDERKAALPTGKEKASSADQEKPGGTLCVQSEARANQARSEASTDSRSMAGVGFTKLGGVPIPVASHTYPLHSILPLVGHHHHPQSQEKVIIIIIVIIIAGVAASDTKRPSSISIGIVEDAIFSLSGKQTSI